MKYMNGMKVADLDALESLGDITWGWDLQYTTEPTLSHGRFYFRPVDPNTKVRYTFDGYTIKECVDKFKQKIEKESIIIVKDEQNGG